MYYLIQYVNRAGIKTEILVEANNPDQAITDSKIPSEQIDDVSVSVWESLRGVFELSSQGMPLIDQYSFLAMLSTSIASGTPAIQALYENAKDNKFLVRKCEGVRDFQVLSDALKFLRFELSVVTVIASADETGDYVSVLANAAQFAERMDSIRNSYSGTIKKAKYISLFVLAIVFVTPFFLSGLIQNLGSITGNEEKNLATLIILNAPDFYLYYGWLVLLGVIIFLRKRNLIMYSLRKVPPFGFFVEFSQIIRSISFVSVYKLMFRYDFTPQMIISSLQKNANNIDKEYYKKMALIVESGKSMSEAFSKDYWPSQMIGVFKNIEDKRPEEVEYILNSTENALYASIKKMATKMSKAVETGILFSLSLVVIFMFMGIFYPILGSLGTVSF